MAALHRSLLALQAPAPGGRGAAAVGTREGRGGRGRSASQPVRWLALPEAGQRLRFGLQRWFCLLPGLYRRHRLLPIARTRYASRTTSDADLRRRLAELLDLRERVAGRADPPFLCLQGMIELLQARVFADLGVNLRHLRLLRHRSCVFTSNAAALAGGVQDIDCGLVRLVRVGPAEVLVILNTDIADGSGRLLATIDDAFVVEDLPVASAAKAEEDDLLRRAVSRTRRHSREITSRDDICERPLYCDASIAGRFARIVGGSPRLLREERGQARWPWERRAATALPPMLVRHLVARELLECGLDLRRFEISFVATIPAGRMLRLLQHDGRFELVDRRGRLLAFGRC